MRKPYVNLLAVVALLLGLLATVPTKTALADCDETDPTDILCTGSDTDGVVTDGGGSNSDPDVVTVEAGATVDTSTGGCDAVESDGELSVFNDGTINGDCDGIDVDDDLIDLTNTGAITGYWQGVDITYDIEGTVDNSGTIVSTNSDAVRVGDSLDGALNNSGDILGDDNGIYIDNYLDGTIVNSGNIIGYGSDGIYIGAEDPNYGSITNTGVISGYYTGIYSDDYVEVYNSGDIIGENGDGVNLGDWDTDSGYLENNTGGEVAGYWDGADFEGDGTVYNDGLIFGLWGQAVDISEDGLVANDLHGVIDGYDAGVSVGGDALVGNIGEILAYGGDGIYVEGASIILNDGFIWGSDEGIDTSGGYETYVYSSGTIMGGDTAIDTSYYNDVVVLDSGSLTAGGSEALELYDGDDIVYLGAGGVSYGTACGDVSVTTVVFNPATVVGTMYGDENGYGGYDDSDTLIFGLLSSNEADVDAFLAGLDPEGGSVSDGNGGTYDWAYFETLSVSATIYTEGAQRLFDDGVVLAFANGGKIDVCSGEKGFRAGTVDMGALDIGQRTFSAGNEGWFVVVNDLGGGQFEAHIFDGSGVEHFNDADGNGAADSTFVFSR